jgi:hypothetical protein
MLVVQRHTMPGIGPRGQGTPQTRRSAPLLAPPALYSLGKMGAFSPSATMRDSPTATFAERRCESKEIPSLSRTVDQSGGVICAKMRPESSNQAFCPRPRHA